MPYLRPSPLLLLILSVLLSVLILSCDPDEAKKKPTTQDQDDKNPADPTTKPADKPENPTKPVTPPKPAAPVASLGAVSSKTAASDGGEDARTKADTSGTSLGWVFQDKEITFSTTALDEHNNEIPTAKFVWEWRKRGKEKPSSFGRIWTPIKGQATATATLTIDAKERVGAYELRVSATSGKKTVDNHKETPYKFTVRKSGCPAPSAKNAPVDLATLQTMVAGSSPSVTGEDLKAIDTSLIEDMQTLFFNKTAFNGNISCWDVSKVTNMYAMFSDANAFNQNIGAWDVSKVTNMRAMFTNANAFNQNIGAWDVSKVTNMENMFFAIEKFNNGGNASIGNWDVSNVTNMNNMFIGAKVFNQNLNNWNVSKVRYKNNFALFTPAWTNNAHLPDRTWPNS